MTIRPPPRSKKKRKAKPLVKSIIEKFNNRCSNCGASLSWDEFEVEVVKFGN